MKRTTDAGVQRHFQRIAAIAFLPAILTAAIAHRAVGAEAVKDADAFISSPSYAAATKLFPPPGTKRIYLQQPCDDRIVQGRPDLKFQMKPAIGQQTIVGVGFVILKEGRPESFEFDRTEQQFADRAYPMLTQKISQSGFVFEQTSFTTADSAGRRFLAIRMRVARENDASPKQLALGWLAVCQPHNAFQSHGNEDYIVFEPWAPAWQSPRGLRYDDTSPNCGVQHDGEFVFSTLQGSDNVSIQSDDRLKGTLSLVLAFDNAKEAVIDVRVPYECLQRPGASDAKGWLWQPAKAFRIQDAKQLASLAFDEVFSRQSQLWKTHLDRAARIEVPEEIVEQVYQTLTLNNHQFLGSHPSVGYCRPGQGGFNNFSVVYGWESSCYLTVMDRQGYGDEVRRVLDYFLTTQQGTHGPEGDISTAEGAFRPHIHWMCETGAILRVFAEHAICHRDVEDLRRDSPALLKAARWIQGQRARTKQTETDGQKVAHYGLMPRGRGTDWPDAGYQFFTDSFTWQGLDRLALAYETLGLPDAKWLRDEADDYHRCILDAVARALKPHPLDPSLQWVPDEVYEDPAKSLPTTIFAGPQGLLSAGVVAPDNPLVPTIEASLRKAGCMNDLFAFRMKTMEDATLKKLQEKSAGGPVDLYYVTNCERMWHRLWIERGERLKALRVFYMTLAYATSRDLHIVHERYCPQLRWLLPWQPNGSGNGRVLEMILNALAFEKGDAMCLFYGAPDAWFTAGKPIGVSDLHTSFGTLSFQLIPGDKPGAYRLRYECSDRVPAKFLVAIPTGDGPENRRTVEISTDNQKTATREIR